MNPPPEVPIIGGNIVAKEVYRVEKAERSGETKESVELKMARYCKYRLLPEVIADEDEAVR